MQNLWKQVSEKLKEKIEKNIYDLWFESIKIKSFINNTMILLVPNIYFQQRIQNDYLSEIKVAAKSIINLDIEIKIEINSALALEYNLNPKVTTKQKIYDNKNTEQKKTIFENNPNFNNQDEFWRYSNDAKQFQQSQNEQILQLNSMPAKYGETNIACFTTFDSRFFTYPSDKRKKVKIEIKIPFNNGIVKTYNLYRGQFVIGDEGRGQLNTTHARILLAIVHLWQKQGCKFADTNGFFSVVNISIRELAQQLGYKNFGGRDFKRLFNKIMELIEIPNLLVDGTRGFAFTFINKINVLSDTTNRNKTVLRLAFDPFIAKQLYERKAFLRNPQCYKIKNPSAFKFLIHYDKKIFKGNKLKLKIEEVAKDLQLNYKRLDNLLRVFSHIIKEINGYVLNENYNITVELLNEQGKYYVIAERISNRKLQVKLLN
jgi:hypothetical protein